MREIKFRGWHMKLSRMFSPEEMAVDQLTLLTTGAFINVSGSSQSESVIYPADKFIPLQYTGLKDAKDREIFEGDIIKIWPNDTKTCTVEFYKGCFRITLPSGIVHELDIHIGTLEVIGSIYENPELVKS